MHLLEIIQQRIMDEGPVSFYDFMEMALYYPGLGYYMSGLEKIGRKGDYFTSPSLTPRFGATIARQLVEMWALLGEKKFSVVEYGAGNGFLCHDILDALKLNPELYDNLHYYIIEKSPVMQAKQRTHLHEKVSWCNSISEIDGLIGCILSNELVDNFAVHQVIMEDELMEVFVDHKNDFVEVLKPADEELINYLADLDIILPKGFRTEINLNAIKWIGEIATGLKKGYVITIDYGHSSRSLYSEQRRRGTIVCYNKHSINEDPYHNIGGQDITSHVNFSALCHWGIKSGLECSGFTDQAHFLLALGFKDHLNKTQVTDLNAIQSIREEAIITRTLLVDMGTKFKVLIQQKNAPPTRLIGLSSGNFAPELTQ